MGGLVHLITHPEVIIDPAVPVRRWGLTPAGAARLRLLAAEPLLAGVGSVWASTEAKAIEGAGILAGALGHGVRVLDGLGENDRSATGFLPPAEFEAMADAFFARPEESPRGWERAVDAQARMVAAMGEVIAASREGDVAVVTHGAVGSLLRGWLGGWPISRALDQPGQGCRFAFPRADFRAGGCRAEWIRLPG